jgi:NADPH:quinone reductase-like Zn-dependent oxidoreductase
MISPVTPRSTKALILREVKTTAQGQLYHDVSLEERPLPELKAGEVLVKMGAVAFNRRDVRALVGFY